MSSKDASHATIGRALVQAFGEDNVVDTSNVGGGFPDFVVGHRQETVLIEVKEPEKEYDVGTVASTRCANCGHQWVKHRARACTGGPRKKPCECVRFRADVTTKKRTMKSGRVSSRQKKFHAAWDGCPIEVIAEPGEVDGVRVRMAERAFDVGL